MEVIADALLKIVTKGSFRGKISENLAVLGYVSEAKKEECDLSKLCFFHNFGTFIPSSDTYFLEVSTRVFCI